MTIAIDTSIAIPLLVQTHSSHRRMRAWAAAKELALSGHALADTYSVLTRLPGDLRLGASEAHLLLQRWFAPPLIPAEPTTAGLTGTLSQLGLAGGAFYDALVALAARDHGVALASADGRARPTYEAVGVEVLVVPVR